MIYDNSGDYMKYNFLIPILSAILLGYLCASFILIKYDNTKEINNSKIVYFIQRGVYKNIENSKDDLADISNKLILKEDDKYYVYIGITYSKKTALKIKDIYKENNIETYIKEKSITNKEFLLELEQYDILLKNTKTKEELESILETIIATFEEDISDGGGINENKGYTG